MTAWITAVMSIIAAYTITSNISRSSSRPVVSVKMCLVAIIVLCARLRGSMDDYNEETGTSLMSLILQAAMEGFWESAAFSWILAQTVTDRVQLRERTCYLLALVAGHWMLPRLVLLCGLPSHTSNEEDPLEGVATPLQFHITCTLIVYAIINEMLISLLPAVFSRAYVVVTQQDYVTISPHTHPTADRSKYRVGLNLLNYILLVGALIVVPSALESVTILILHPVSTLATQIAEWLRLSQSLVDDQRRLADALRLALKGSTGDLRALFSMDRYEWAIAIVGLLQKLSVLSLFFCIPSLMYVLVSQFRRLARWVGVIE